jgi:homoserine O-succinyltransferase/O-acetyltransferase
MITIGLVNNMPDKALRGTDRQFRDLLSRASVHCNLRIFADCANRSIEAQRYIDDSHSPIGEIWDAGIDGLVVTGMEPKTPELANEPCWPLLTTLADWAASRKIPTVWSCLAAHALVRYLDGIERNPLPEKVSGVFDCSRAEDHLFFRHHPPKWFTPHSRYNEIRESDLLDCGYQILSKSPVAGVDIFAKCDSLFLFVQGHPEYDIDVLYREYRRDVGRYLTYESNTYPEIPRGPYFPDWAIRSFERFRDGAMQCRDSMALNEFPQIVWDALPVWQKPAVQLYANWLAFLVIRRELGFCFASAVVEP